MQLGKTGGLRVLYPPPPWTRGFAEKFAFFTSILAWPETSLTVSLAFNLLYSIFYVYFKDGRIVTVLLDSTK